MAEQDELGMLREVLQSKEQEIQQAKHLVRQLKAIAWSQAEILNKHDVETDEALKLRRELESL